MKRINTPTATQDHKFRDGNKATGVAATQFSAEWCNDVQEELCNIIEGLTGRPPTGLSQDEVLKAIKRGIACYVYWSIYTTTAQIFELYDGGKLPLLKVEALNTTQVAYPVYFRRYAVDATHEYRCVIFALYVDSETLPSGDEKVIKYYKFENTRDGEIRNYGRFVLTAPDVRSIEVGKYSHDDTTVDGVKIYTDSQNKRTITNVDKMTVNDRVDIGSATMTGSESKTLMTFGPAEVYQTTHNDVVFGKKGTGQKRINVNADDIDTNSITVNGDLTVSGDLDAADASVGSLHIKVPANSQDSVNFWFCSNHDNNQNLYAKTADEGTIVFATNDSSYPCYIQYKDNDLSHALELKSGETAAFIKIGGVFRHIV